MLPAGGAPEKGKIKACKVRGAGSGGTTTINRVGTDAGTAGTLTRADPLALAAGECGVVATTTADGHLDYVSVTEVLPSNANLVSAVLVGHVESGPNPEFPYTPGTDIGFNVHHGATVLFTNHYTPPPPPPQTQPVCDFSTFGGFVLKPNNISYGGNAGRDQERRPLR